MRLALAEDFAAIPGVTVVMTLDDRLADEPGGWGVLRVRPGEERATFARLAAVCDYTLCVAPETGGVLEDRARMIEEVDGWSLGCSPEAVALCGDKLRLADHLIARAIPTPPSRRVWPREGLPRDHPYPAVLKPIDGAGSLDTYFVDSPDDLPDPAKAIPEALLQPFEAGSPMSAAFLVAEDGEPLLVGLAEQHVERRDGQFAYRGGRVPADGPIPAPVVEAVRSIPGLRGWVGVDFVRCEMSGRVVVLEINPRATTSFVGWREVAPEPGALAREWLHRAGNRERSREEGTGSGGTRPVPAPIAGGSTLKVRFWADGGVEREEPRP